MCVTSLGTWVPPWHGPMRHQGPSTQNTIVRSSEADGEQRWVLLLRAGGGGTAVSSRANRLVSAAEIKEQTKTEEKSKGRQEWLFFPARVV